MTEQDTRSRGTAVDPAMEELAQHIADSVESFLVALQALSREIDGGRTISMLLLELSQLLLAGARLGAQSDFTPEQQYQPDVGPDPDLDAMRLRLAKLLGPVDTYADHLDPYDPELVVTRLSDELATIGTEVANGLRHFRAGDVHEALWWWQFSYVSSWGSSANGALRALQSIIAHDRLDHDDEVDAERVAAANEMLAGRDRAAR